MQIEEITSIGTLNNHDGSIALCICIRYHLQPVFVTISREELENAGGIASLKKNKQLAIDFYRKYGAGRP